MGFFGGFFFSGVVLFIYTNVFLIGFDSGEGEGRRGDVVYLPLSIVCRVKYCFDYLPFHLLEGVYV